MPVSRVGSELAGYRIESVVGVGGMAVVYLAEHLRLGRRVALKVLSPEQAQDDVFRERFIRESRIAARLDHPNVVTVYDAGEAEGVLYISMRFVQGTDLEHLIVAESKLEPSRAISIVTQCAAALDAAHAEGLVHRDVKPANILLERDRRTGADHAFLSDFGITKRLRTEAGLTRTGSFVGTVDYVAPEQIKDWEVDGRADVYSLGCVMYRCLTGEVPFPRTTDVATIYAHLAQPPPSVGDRPGVSGEFDGVIARALAKSPDERFRTCRELAEAAAAAGVGFRRAATIPRRHRRRRSRRATALSVGLVAVILAAGATWILATRSRSPGEHSQGGPTTLRLRWDQASRRNLGGARRQDIVKAVATGSSAIAIGHDFSGVDEDAAAWTSTDGSSWTRVPTGDLGGPGDQELNGLAVQGTDVVGVGSDTSGGTLDAAVWISKENGASWSRVIDPGLVATGDQVMRRVIAAPTGLVALGYDDIGSGRDAAVWTSTDGELWTPVPSTEFEGIGDQEIFGVTTFGSEIVAVGSSATAAGDLDAAVWIESEGVWSRATSDPLGGPRDQQMTSVLATGSGLVAVGYDTSGGDHDAAVWTSTNGANWTRVPPEGFTRGGNQQMYALTQVGATLVAAGTSETSSGDTNAAIWLSADGSSWTQVPGTDLSMSALVGPAEQRVKSLVVFDGLLVALGSEAQGGRDDAAVWFARLPQADVSPTSGSPTSASP